MNKTRTTMNEIRNQWQLATLQKLGKAPAYTLWQFSLLTPHLGKNILELGCGTGIITKHLLETNATVTAVDQSAIALSELIKHLSPGPRLRLVRADLADPSLWHTLSGPFDTIVAINVLEHLSDDLTLFKSAASLLGPGGQMLVIVPASPRLFGSADEIAGHHRRYRKKDLARLISLSGLAAGQITSFNLVGALGWWIRFVWRRERRFSTAEIGWMDKLSPCLQKLEALIPVPFGLSLFARACHT